MVNWCIWLLGKIKFNKVMSKHKELSITNTSRTNSFVHQSIASYSERFIQQSIHTNDVWQSPPWSKEAAIVFLKGCLSELEVCASTQYHTGIMDIACCYLLEAVSCLVLLQINYCGRISFCVPLWVLACTLSNVG